MSQRPETFSVQYHDRTIKFTRFNDPPRSGYQYVCPVDGKWSWVDTDSGERHKLSFDEHGRATVIGSLGHMSWGCPFHVIIKDGVAHDA